MNRTRKTVSETLYYLRLSKGKTIHEVATKANIKDLTLIRIEKGKFTPNAQILGAIINALY